MRKLFFTLLSLTSLLPVMAQTGAEKLLQKTVSKLEKDGSICIIIEAETRNEDNVDLIDLEVKLSPDGSFCAKEDGSTMWFDGKTMWRGNDFGDGIEEIYITEPTPEEKARYDIIGLLRKHQGFSVSGNGTDTFILNASNTERSVEGIRSVTVTVDPKTNIIRSAGIIFSQELGGISVTAKVKSYLPEQNYDKATFICPIKDYKDADIIDLR